MARVEIWQMTPFFLVQAQTPEELSRRKKMGKMEPVCVKCRQEMTCIKNEVIVWHPTEPVVGNPIEDIDFVVEGDLYRCPICGYEIVTGFGGIRMACYLSQQAMKDLIESAPAAFDIRRLD